MSTQAALQQLLEQRALAVKPFPWQHALFILVKYDRYDNTLRLHYGYYASELLQWLGPLSSLTDSERRKYEIESDIPPELLNGSCTHYAELLRLPVRVVAAWLLENQKLLHACHSQLVGGVSPRIQRLRNCNEPLV